MIANTDSEIRKKNLNNILNMYFVSQFLTNVEQKNLEAKSFKEFFFNHDTTLCSKQYFKEAVSRYF